MCGIAGALSLGDNSFEITESYITRLRDTLSHRGPDGSGVWISDDKRVGLGHRRLSIIDLSEAASQPMSNEDGTLWVSFNGEIYNHQEIRVELEKIGRHRWKTDHSDTEVILHAFEQWGIDCLEKFRGIFAIALYDEKAKELWLIRDRLGVKPLYYSIHNGRIVFASEIKAILEDPDQKRAVDEEALFHFLSFLAAPPPQTMFEGIKKLPCATWLRISANGQTGQHRWWDMWDHTTPLTDRSEDEIAEMILAELRTAVRLRKVSDVPVGIFLSGGVDSSANAALFSEDETDPIKSFTIGYQGEYRSYPNETRHARKMADLVKAEYHQRLLSVDDLISFLPEMVRLQDEPIGDPVCVPVYYVSKLARDNGVIVCQVGEGADELFWGYRRWKWMLRFQKWNDLPFTDIPKKAGLAVFQALGQDKSYCYEWLRRGVAGQPIFWGGAEAFTEIEKQQLLSARLRKKFSGWSTWDALLPFYRSFREKAWEKSAVNWMSHLDLNFRLPELLLMRVDKMSMGVGLEGRVPYLDHKLVELAMSIPQAVKTRNGTLKYMLKKSVRGLVPDELISRKKQGFGVPVYEWFFDRLGERTKTELTDFCGMTDFLDTKEVIRITEKERGPKLWNLLNLALWWKQYMQ